LRKTSLASCSCVKQYFTLPQILGEDFNIYNKSKI